MVKGFFPFHPQFGGYGLQKVLSVAGEQEASGQGAATGRRNGYGWVTGHLSVLAAAPQL